jgi:hypothetical protein
MFILRLLDQDRRSVDRIISVYRTKVPFTCGILLVIVPECQIKTEKSSRLSCDEHYQEILMGSNNAQDIQSYVLK